MRVLVWLGMDKTVFWYGWFGVVDRAFLKTISFPIPIYNDNHTRKTTTKHKETT